MQTVELVGGFSTEAEADGMLGLTATMFPDWDIVDRQKVNLGFEDGGPIVVRIAGSDLFGTNTAELNSDYFGTVDQLAAFLVANPGTRVTIIGYGADGSLDQAALAEDRAATGARRLRQAGVPSAVIDIVEVGEQTPVLSTGLETSPQSLDFLIS